MKVNINTGGRENYFDAIKVGDCVTRAVAIATQQDYKEVYDAIHEIVGYSPRNGVRRKDVKKVMAAFGGKWHSCMAIGSGCKVHLADNEVPMKGHIICQLSHHVCAVIDGVINDTFDCSRNGTRCVYGYWDFTNWKLYF